MSLLYKNTKTKTKIFFSSKSGEMRKVKAETRQSFWCRSVKNAEISKNSIKTKIKTKSVID